MAEVIMGEAGFRADYHTHIIPSEITAVFGNEFIFLRPSVFKIFVLSEWQKDTYLFLL